MKHHLKGQQSDKIQSLITTVRDGPTTVRKMGQEKITKSN